MTTLSMSFHVFSIVFRSITTEEEHDRGSAEVELEEEEGEDAPDPAWWPFTDTWLKAPCLRTEKFPYYCIIFTG